MTLRRLLLACCCLALASIRGNDAAPAATTTSTSFQNSTDHFSFILLGATGDLSKREIFPALWSLYRDNLLAKNVRIFGYARRPSTVDELRKKVEPFLVVRPGEEQLYDEFWTLCEYLSSLGDPVSDYDRIDRVVSDWEGADNVGNRIYYLAIPPSAFESTATQIERAGMAKRGWTRIVIEKPFGRDSESSAKLSAHLTKLFAEDQIYRMDHFLGYEMAQNLLPLRFSNEMLAPSWSRNHIAAVEIDFKENFGVEGRGAFFDEYGIVRDVMQNHLLQIVSLIAMEKPRSMSPDDVRNAKVDLLKKMRVIQYQDVVIGQYVGNPDSDDPRERIGYLEDPTVPKGSITSTFAMTVLKIDNPRWRGVPFIIRAGKGLNINQTDVIVQYKAPKNDIFNGQSQRNKLIYRIGMSEAILAKVNSKSPGLTNDIQKIDVDFFYKDAFPNVVLPGGYVRLLLDVFNGSQKDFVRIDELTEAWRVFTPILHKIENEKIRPIDYVFGSTGPKEADDLEKKYNFL